MWCHTQRWPFVCYDYTRSSQTLLKLGFHIAAWNRSCMSCDPRLVFLMLGFSSWLSQSLAVAHFPLVKEKAKKQGTFQRGSWWLAVSPSRQMVRSGTRPIIQLPRVTAPTSSPIRAYYCVARPPFCDPDVVICMWNGRSYFPFIHPSLPSSVPPSFPWTIYAFETL